MIEVHLRVLCGRQVRLDLCSMNYVEEKRCDQDPHVAEFPAQLLFYQNLIHLRCQ